MENNISAKDALVVNFWIFRICGAWVAGISSPALRLLYNLFGAVNLSCITIVYFSTEIIYVVYSWGDMEAIGEILFLLLTHIGSLVKLTNIMLRRKRLEKLVEDSCRTEFIPRNTAHRNILASTIRKANKENIFFCSIVTFTVTGLTIVPLLEAGEESTSRLPLPGWFPFDVSKSPTFAVTYVLQAYAHEMIAILNAMMDTFASVLMALSGAQLDILCHDLLNLGSEESFASEYVSSTKTIEGKSKVGTTEKEDKLKRKPAYIEEGGVAVAEEFPVDITEDIWHRRLVDCIEHHAAIIRFSREIQEIFGMGILAQFAISSTILCLTCFELTLLSPSSSRFYTLLLYQSCMLFQIWVYCWHGNGIIVKTSKLMTKAFHSNWSSCSPKFKSTLRIMMCRMQRPMELRVGRLVGLSLETFSMILRGAYSFYAVIQQVRSEDN